MTYNNPMPAAPVYGNYSPLSPMGTQYMQQPQVAPAPQVPSFGVRPVTGREEAVAAQVDFGGPGTLMPDLGHGVIYLKRFNPNTGACDLFDFTVRAPEAAATAREVAKKYGLGGNAEFYADMAHAWLDDKDAVEDKAAAYYCYVVQH